jgi:hypothetical protein
MLAGGTSIFSEKKGYHFADERSLCDQLLVGLFWALEYRSVSGNMIPRRLTLTCVFRHILPESAPSRIFFPTQADLVCVMTPAALPKGKKKKRVYLGS